MRPLFVHVQDVDLTAEQVLELFSDIQYSKIGSTKRLSEETTSRFWHEFINDLANRLIGKHMHNVYICIRIRIRISAYIPLLYIHSLNGEEKATALRLEDLLLFVTGVDHIPPFGFANLPEVLFIHQLSGGVPIKFPWLTLVRRPSACQHSKRRLPWSKALLVALGLE